MTNKEWRKLWLEIAEDISRGYESLYCLQLLRRGHQDIYSAVNSMTSWVNPDPEITNLYDNLYWYFQTDFIGNDYRDCKIFTACFIAEIGEAEFCKLAEEV